MRNPSVSVLVLVLFLSSGFYESEASQSMRSVMYASSTTSTTTAMASNMSPSPSSVSQASNANAIGNFVGYIKTTITRFIDGGQELWVNYGTCKDIRSKIKAYQDTCRDQWLEQGLYKDEKEMKDRLKSTIGGISFEEYDFLQKGKEDRSKLMSLGFIVFGAPRFLPYALMFQPDMLPRPLKPPLMVRDETLWEKLSRERSAIIVETLLKLEKDARTIPALAKINIFGRTKQQTKMENMRSFNQQILDFLSTTGVENGARPLLEQLEPWLYSNQPFPRAVSRLSQVPMAITKGLGDALLGGGLLNSISPAFMQRGRLVGHLRKVAECDTFLVNTNVNISTIPTWLLRETCSDRLMGSAGMSTEALQARLQEWLTLIEAEPRQRLESSSTASQYYNDNLARTALMGYYAMQGTQDEGTACTLPRALYRSSTRSTETPESSTMVSRFLKR